MRSRTGGAAAPTLGLSNIKESPPSPNEKKKAAEDEWEVRPGGMLVQKSATLSGRVPTIRVKVKHGAIYHEIYISSQASFGELKKQVSERIGVHHMDMKVTFKDKERDSASFLDAAGVKDKSKLVVAEDPVAQAKRLLEQRRTDKIEKAAKSVSSISLEVDKLATKVSAIEGIVNKGGRVVENDVVNLIELLMNQLVKLDDIVGADDGDVKLQRRMQVKRVQKYVETLDVIKIKNAQQKTKTEANNYKQEEKPKSQRTQKNQQAEQRQYQPTRPQYQYHQQQQQQPLVQIEQPAVVANNWEFFDSLFTPTASTPTSSTTTAASTASSTPTTRFDWELF